MGFGSAKKGKGGACLTLLSLEWLMQKKKPILTELSITCWFNLITFKSRAQKNDLGCSHI